MNGFEATAAIRAREATDGRPDCRSSPSPRTSMQGDRERCLAAGMDSYATKPIQPTELFATVARAPQQHPRRFPCPRLPLTRCTRPRPYRTLRAGRRRSRSAAQSDRDVPQRQRPGDGKLEHALATGNAEDVQQGAHRLKGALLTLGGKPAAEVAMRLEHMGREGDLADGPAALDAAASTSSRASIPSSRR